MTQAARIVMMEDARIVEVRQTPAAQGFGFGQLGGSATAATGAAPAPRRQ